MSTREIILLLIFTMFICKSNELFGGLKKLKEKAKKQYKKKFGKDQTWHFLGQDLSEYPGTNDKFRKINQDKWDDYYSCLRTQNENIGEQRSISPFALQAFQGSFLSLECKLCISPKERRNIDSVKWYFATPIDTSLKLLEYTEHILISPEDKTLLLYSLQIENTGQYVCMLGESLTAPYFLTVVDIPDNEVLEVHSPEAAVGPYPQSPEKISGYDLVLETEWGEWSSCSKCKHIGRRHKFGYCIVMYNKQMINSTTHEHKNETRQKSEVTAASETDLELFKIFKYGIPCSSHILPKSIKKMQQVRDRKNEMMTGYCKVPCPEEKVFEVRDKDGKVLERANNSAGIYSLLQGLPSSEPSVERRLQYGAKGKNIVLNCPGNLNDDAPIRWQIGEKNVVPELLSEESKGRIFISITDKIHIKQAKIADSNIYSCWQHNEVAGIISLVVEKKLELDFNHHLMLLGILIILSTFLLVCFRAFIGRKHAKT